jgi:hypothetical protein
VRVQNYSKTGHIINLIFFRSLSVKVLFSKSSIFLVFANLKIGTPSFRRAILDLVPSEAVMRLRKIIDIFHETSVEILETKKEALRRGDQALAAQIGQGKDIISILCAISFFYLLQVHSAHKTMIFSEGEYESFRGR